LESMSADTRWRIMWIKKHATAGSNDFQIDEETGRSAVKDGDTHVIGGIITAKTIKSTRTNSIMAFIMLEDLLGTVEVIVFPKDYEKYKSMLEVDQKIFVKGRVTVEEEKPAKLICQKIVSFDSIPQELWIKYADFESFLKDKQTLYSILDEYDGNDSVIIFCEKEKCLKKLPKSRNVKAGNELIERLNAIYSEENIRISEKSIENILKID